MADLTAVPGDGHEALPVPETSFTLEGRNANRLADPQLPWHFPAEAICSTCWTMIRREQYMAPGAPDKDAWQHTGRKPGES